MHVTNTKILAIFTMKDYFSKRKQKSYTDTTYILVFHCLITPLNRHGRPSVAVVR